MTAVNSLDRSKDREKVNFILMMDLYILAIGQMIKKVGLAKLYLLIKTHMKEIGKMIILMGKVFIYTIQETLIKAIL